MAWIPDLPGLLGIIKRIEAGEDLIHNSFDLFWTFCNTSLSPDEFTKRLSQLREGLLGRNPAGHYTDPEIDDLIHRALEDPSTVVKAVIDRLDTLCKSKRIPYCQDQPEDIQSLYASVHMDSARLVRLLNLHNTSIETKTVLNTAFDTQFRCEKALGNYSNAPWPEIYSPSLKALGSFLSITQFHIQKAEGEYEEALVSVAKGIEIFQQVRLLVFPLRGQWARTFEEVQPYTVNSQLQQSAPWMDSLDSQELVNCFEAIRRGKRIKDRKQFASICQQLLNLCAETLWLKPKEKKNPWDIPGFNFQPTLAWQSNYWRFKNPWEKPTELKEVQDTDGEHWEPTLFWQRANWWAQSQLEPSEIQTLIQTKEDQAAEERLHRYFFDDELWELLPDRARSSLISADRDWFGGERARIEALLNHLKVATEELLLHGLWEPLGQWVTNQGDKPEDRQYFLDLKTELDGKGFIPDISHYEIICRMNITTAFLKKNAVKPEDRQWFFVELPKSLKRLRKARRRAEHESSGKWTHLELQKFIAEFLGIGQSGVLPRLTRVLLAHRST
jgi:hypothetical protein